MTLSPVLYLCLGVSFQSLKSLDKLRYRDSLSLCQASK